MSTGDPAGAASVVDAVTGVAAGPGWLTELARGRVFQARGVLATIDPDGGLRRALIDAVAEVASPEAAARVARDGVERLHEALTGPELYALEARLSDRLARSVDDLVGAFVRRVGGHAGRFFVCGRVWVRFFVPQDVFAANRELFSRRVGHLAVQNPHRDWWFTNPRNASVIWLALGRVRHGNGMLIYPERWGQPVDHDRFESTGHRIDPGTPLGRPVSFALEAGDALVFHGDHLHSSEVNVTEETRCVVSFRFTLEPPVAGEGNRWLVYRDSRLSGGPFASLAGMRSRLSTTYVRYLAQRRVGYAVRRRLGRVGRERPAAPGRAPSPSLWAPVDPAGHADLAVGEIRPAGPGVCVTRLGDGSVVAFSRFCPHAGADLAHGVVDGGQVRCAWHHVPFDLATGASPCRSIPPLTVGRAPGPG